MRAYRYIGPKQIADRATRRPAGTPIRSTADVVGWVCDSGQRPGPDGCVIATFVVDVAGGTRLPSLQVAPEAPYRTW
jgi:hypothetical protein